MIPFSELPINSLAWMLGTFATMSIAVKSWLAYRRSYGQLTKYMFWFSLLISISLALFGFPSLFTLNESFLHVTYIVAEVFMYAAFVAQGAILWALILRQYAPLKAVTVPVGLAGLAIWLYATPNSRLFLEDDFIGYREPLICNYALAGLFFVLFIPVGLHFIQATARQVGFKNRLVTFGLGLIYVLMGLSAGIKLITVRNIVDPQSSLWYIAFFVFLLAVTVWPRRQKAKTVLPETGYQRLD